MCPLSSPLLPCSSHSTPMGPLWMFCATVAAAIAAIVMGTQENDVYLWPMPASVSHGTRTLCLGVDFALDTKESEYVDRNGILKEGFQRMIDLVWMDRVVNGDANACGDDVLAGMRIAIGSRDDQLDFGVDESYKLTVPAGGRRSYARIEANTVFGALHGLQTFSQMCYFNFSSHVIELGHAPWSISDEPRFPFRGLLIDTSRHYQPLKMMKKVIDAMAYTKLNVLHWHIVDDQSFPLQVPSYPKLWNGAYSYLERYTLEDAAEIVQYAKKRGINVMPEIDVPGHALSWGIGYPYLRPSVRCRTPLDVSRKFTFKVIDGILSDLSKVFTFKFFHLGGDEVNTSCWTTTPHVRNWLKKKKMDEKMAYKYFVQRAQKIAISHGYEIVNWEEPFYMFGDVFSTKTVVHNWLRKGVAQKAVAAGLRCIISNQDKWYLDHLDATWEDFYTNEPLKGIREHKQQKLVVGGEICLWGETVDASDIEQTIWPRAAAAAERLWSPLSKLGKDPELVAGRLAKFRCLLDQRGIAAAPLNGAGRTAPYEPGSCYRQ